MPTSAIMRSSFEQPVVAESSRQVAFLDLGAAYRELRGEIDEAVHRVLSSGWYVLGDELDAFENEFAAYVHADHCVGVGNGFDALVLALRAVGVVQGDEVLVPSNTCVATWLAVSAVGATPVPVEPDPATHVVAAEGVERRITERTSAILPVHLYGQPVEVGPILRLAHDRGLRVVADAAQAHGARCEGVPLGALGDAVCWSFYPSKNLGALGDGGAVTTSSSAIAERVRVLRNYGSPARDVHTDRGVNSRLDELQAAVLRVKLGHLDEWNRRRAQIAERYVAALRDLPSFTPPSTPEAVSPVWHQFVVRHPARDRLRVHLSSMGIETLVHYPRPPHRQAACADRVDGLALPIADQLAQEVLSLPIGPHLRAQDLDLVLDGLRRFEQKAGEARR